MKALNKAFIRDNNTKYQWHSHTQPGRDKDWRPIVIARGDGCHVEDIDGNRYVDGLAGLWCVNVGHNRQEIKQAIADQLDQIEYYASFLGTTTPPSIELSKKLIEMTAQEGMDKVIFSSGGSDAVENALKIARQYWRVQGKGERTKFLSLKQGYHGIHIGGASVNGNTFFRSNYEPLLPGCYHVATPWLYHNPWTQDPEELAAICADLLEREIVFQGPETIAAFIAEPVQGAGGIIIPPASYWPRVRAICDKYGILLIADEVVTGFGRAGEMFGVRAWGVKPDIMTLAKGISSGYIPLGATVLSEKVTSAWENSTSDAGILTLGYTYGGHPVACAAALACLDITEKEDLPGNAKRQGERMLSAVKHFGTTYKSVGDVRGMGLMVCLELVSDKKTKEPVDEGFVQQLASKVMEAGVIIRPAGGKLIASPPLVINDAECDKIVEALTYAFDALDRH
ncbi:aminotransferase class III-fold pyridoxal phosphate-dependent enzyme [Pseudomonas benzenivorans]|uniref:Aminotransferase class III-fold pyridoxal phosphate-dependent enzyme n=1 Tax=Pseudomonas benzenivorans TaxID=556533 RepID=A0ABY5H0W2_9PSED|nr:aminotransferase class III-fold pyridoxal phosphate-dependent enzyme [Pseudomonas benzenivorans]UTW05892.1 aminotransferase class III-fold pyridoxal phosphate-dependent enzyme [Pseudomonas benzenivorans]